MESAAGNEGEFGLSYQREYVGIVPLEGCRGLGTVIV